MALILIILLTISFPRMIVTEPSNIILLLTDDQDDQLGGLTYMTKTMNLASSRGVRFINAFSTTPVCCPARSSLLTGLYQHNHHVFNNSRKGGCNGQEWQNNFEPFSMGPTLQKAGYTTFYAGKYLNEYVDDRVPIGWDWWAGLMGNSVYYNYTINVNGTKRHFGDKGEDYLTDVVSAWALHFLQIQQTKPYFMVIAPPAPHEPFTPSNKYKGKFSGFKAPRTSNFNTGKSGKHWLVRNSKVLSSSAIKLVDETFASRLETLQSVDDLLSSILNIVSINTYVFFTSDHGFHLGQFSQAWDKRQPYESDIRVPLLVWGPNVPAGAHLTHPVLNIDIAATFYEIGQISAMPNTDGRSLLPLLKEQPPSWDRSFQVEYVGEGGNSTPCYEDSNVKLCKQELECNCFDSRNNTFICTRHLSLKINTLFCKFKDSENFMESYNINEDPSQLTNLLAP